MPGKMMENCLYTANKEERNVHIIYDRDVAKTENPLNSEAEFSPEETGLLMVCRKT
jgi:hypothetical protein